MRIRIPCSGGCLLTVCLAMLLLCVASLSGCGEDEEPVTPPEDELPLSSIPGLSLDQSRVVEESGYPDHFFISIDPYSSDRVEKWIYFTQGKALDFNNGRRFGEEAVEDESGQYPPTGLRPQDFQPLLTPEEAAQMLGEPLYTYDVEDSLSAANNTIVVFNNAILLYKSGQLIGVETKVSPPQVPVPQ
jgi:hypothetical protein